MPRSPNSRQCGPTLPMSTAAWRPSSGGRSRRQPSAQYTTTLLMLLPARRRAALVSLVVSAHPSVGMTNLRGQLNGTFLLLGPTLGQDAAAGEQVFMCSPCHEIGQDAKIKLGPPLNGIDGRKSGTFEGFNYSPANKSSGITWSEETFPKYIRAPMQEMPGTRMAFVGIKNDKDIADLWAYLKQFGADAVKK